MSLPEVEPTYLKDPDAELDYGRDWGVWLVDDELATSEWFVPDGLVMGTDSKAPSFTATTTTVWLSGGTLGETYEVVNRITTTGGRTDERTITIKVRSR